MLQGNPRSLRSPVLRWFPFPSLPLIRVPAWIPPQQKEQQVVADSFMQQLIASLARRTPVLDEPVPYPSGAADAKDSSRRGTRPVLLGEDRPDFERTLDEVLRAHPPGRTEHLNAEQLRSIAITAQEAIVAKAAPEYAHYLEVRKQARIAHGPEAPTASRASGAPVAAVIAVLAPVLFGTAAAIFLLVGYVLRMASPRIAAASSLIRTGWLFAALSVKVDRVRHTG